MMKRRLLRVAPLAVVGVALLGIYAATRRAPALDCGDRYGVDVADIAGYPPDPGPPYTPEQAVLEHLSRGRAADVTASDLVETDRTPNAATILVRIGGKYLVEDQLAGGPGGGWTVVTSKSCLPSTFP
jgi:hypothetical protein